MQYNLFLFSNIITFYIFFFILHFKFVKFKINQFAQTFIFTADKGSLDKQIVSRTSGRQGCQLIRLESDLRGGQGKRRATSCHLYPQVAN